MDLRFRKGTIEDAGTFVQFLDAVKADMEQSDWLYLDPPELVSSMMENGIMELWLAMDKDRVAAVFSVLHPGLESYNYGYDLQLPESDLLRVVHMDTSAVHKDYRGLGLQRKMVQTAEQELADLGDKILLCTVHPDNRFSLENMIQQGYQIQKRMHKYGSERFILRKNIFWK